MKLKIDHSKKKRIMTLAYAGGSAESFNFLKRYISPDTDLIPIEYPGRGARIFDNLNFSFESLVQEISNALNALSDKPTVILGHSFGAMVLFEVMQRVSLNPDSTHLVFSACRAPQNLPSQRVVEATRLQDQAFIEKLTEFGGFPEDLMSKEFMDYYLPIIRQDFTTAASYIYQGGHLDYPYTISYGKQDSHVSHQDLLQWQQVNSKDARYSPYDGGHFYFHDEANAKKLATELQHFLNSLTVTEMEITI